MIRIENSLKRSKESGLYISLRLHRHAPVFDGIWSLIAPHVTRLVDFYFDCGCISTGFCRLNGDPANGLRHVLHELAVAGKAPRLKRLGLKLCDHKGSDPEDTGYSVASLFGGQTPALTHLKLHGVNVDWEGMEWSKALEDLKLERHMEVSSRVPILLAHFFYSVSMDDSFLEQSARPSYATFARVLSSFPKLKTLELDESGPSGSPKDWPSDPAITALYTIENLFLADQKCAYACALLQRFAFPNLKSLTLNLRGYLTPGIHQNYDDLIHTLCSRGPATGKFSGEPEERRWETMVSEIEHLHLFNIRLSLTAARKLYNCLDNLRTLTLRVNELWPQVPMFMDLLDPASERSADCSKDGVRLPRLESLILVNAKQEQVQQFMEVRDRRASVGYPLKRLLTRHLQSTREV